MLVEIKHRWTGAILFSADVDASLATQGLRLGAAVKLAINAGANLAHANLVGADLAGANLAHAYLVGAYLARANGVIDAGLPNGWRCVGWLKDGVIQLRVGCRDKTLAEGRAYWAGKDDRREVLAALDYIETVARARGWAIAKATEKVA